MQQIAELIKGAKRYYLQAGEAEQMLLDDIYNLNPALVAYIISQYIATLDFIPSGDISKILFPNTLYTTEVSQLNVI